LGDEIDEILHLSDTIRREAADLFNQVVGRRGHGTIVAGLAAAWLQRIRRGSSTIGNTSAKAQDRFGEVVMQGKKASRNRGRRRAARRRFSASWFSRSSACSIWAAATYG
jgi:hypothetical protein